MSIERVKYIAEIRDLVSKPLRGIQDQATRTFNKSDRELDEFQANLNSTKAPLQRTRSGLSQTGGSFKRFGGMVSGALGPIAMFAGAAGVGLLAKSIISLGANMEQTRISFDVMLGSAEKGNALISQLQEFANVTPFTDAEVIKSARSLLAYNIEAEKILPTLRSLGDISSGVGKDKLPNLILAFGQVKAASRLTGMELRQFTEAGVPLLDLLSKQLQKPVRVIKEELIPAGDVSFKMVEDALKSATSEGGRFNGLMDRLSQTLGGRFSTLAGKLQLIGIKIGESMTGGLTKFVNAGIKVVDWFNSNLGNLRNVFAPIFEALSPLKGAIMELGEALGFTGTTGDFLAGVFNFIGNQIRRMTPYISAMVKVLTTVFSVVSSIVKVIREWISGNDWLVKGLKGIQGAILGVLTNVYKSMSSILGGLGDVIVGMLTLDKGKITKGVSNLKSGLMDGSLIGNFNAGVAGFRAGYNDRDKDFFKPTGGPTGSTSFSAKASATIPGAPGSGETGKTSLMKGLSSVTGDGRAAKNITINISGGLVGQIDVYAEDPRDFSDQVREKVTEALALALNDSNIIASQ